MIKIWSEEDIIIVNNIRVLNKKATLRFYELYEDKFKTPIDLNKQLFTEEWALKVIEKYPIKSLDEQIEELLLQVDPLNNETFMQFIIDLPHKFNISKITDIKDYATKLASKYNLVFDESSYNNYVEKQIILNYIDKFDIETIISKKIKNLNQLIILLKNINEDNINRLELTMYIMNYLEKNNYFKEDGIKSKELGLFIKSLNSDCYAFNNIIDSICDKYSVLDINEVVNECLKGNKIHKNYSSIEEYIRDYLKENEYSKELSARYLELLIYNIYKRFPKCNDKLVTNLILRCLGNEYEYNEINITVGIVFYKENLKLNSKFESMDINEYMDKYIYNYPYGIEDGFVNSYLYLNEENWRTVVKLTIERIYKLYNEYRKNNIKYYDNITLANLLIAVINYSTKYNSKFYTILLNALKMDNEKYTALCDKFSDTNWQTKKNNIEESLISDIYRGDYSKVHEYLIDIENRKLINNKEFLDRIEISYERLCSLSASKNLKALLNIDAKNITDLQLIEYLACIFYKSEEEFIECINKLGYERVKGIHDLLKQFDIYPYDKLDIIIEKMDKNKELYVDRLYKRSKPKSKKSKKKAFFAFIIGSSIISSIYASLSKNPNDVINNSALSLGNLIKGNESLYELDNKIGDKEDFFKESLESFYKSEENETQLIYKK